MYALFSMANESLLVSLADCDVNPSAAVTRPIDVTPVIEFCMSSHSQRLDLQVSPIPTWLVVFSGEY